MSDIAPPLDSSFFDDPAAPWLLLAHVPRLGIRRWQAVCDAYTDPLDLLQASSATHKAMGFPAEARQLLAAWQRRDETFPTLAQVIARFREARAGSMALVGWGHDDYPDALRHIQDAPLLLYARGDTRLLSRPQIAVIGSRNATRSGLDNAHSFSRVLSERGYLITSGLAQGIDGAAHTGALAAGTGTIAVIGTGVDVIYPHAHRALTAEIINRGLVVSEYPPGTPPKSGHFPRRNRIISGLSRGILVVEAGLRSGSLITARLALEQGREVFAMPGSIHNPLARGCHELIRQGAKLVETVDDIEEEFGAWWAGSESIKAVTSPKPAQPERQLSRPRVVVEKPADNPLPGFLEPREIAVLQALGYDPRSTDQLCSATGLPADQLMQSLLTLEMEGLVASAPGGFQRLA